MVRSLVRERYLKNRWIDVVLLVLFAVALGCSLFVIPIIKQLEFNECIIHPVAVINFWRNYDENGRIRYVVSTVKESGEMCKDYEVDANDFYRLKSEYTPILP